MLAYLLALTIPVSATALLYARWEYRKRGSLSLLGLLIVSAMLFVPNLVLEYATVYEMPGTWLDYLGVFIGVAGLLLCLVSIFFFRSVVKVLCIDTGRLTISGPYRYSRNPQYVGWWLFLFGFALNDWSLWCMGALIVVAVSLHVLVLIEEEHLHRVFGDKYDDFRRKVPRYIGQVHLRT